MYSKRFIRCAVAIVAAIILAYLGGCATIHNDYSLVVNYRVSPQCVAKFSDPAEIDIEPPVIELASSQSADASVVILANYSARLRRYISSRLRKTFDYSLWQPVC